MKQLPWKEKALHLQVGVESLHDGIQKAVGIKEPLEQPGQRGSWQNLQEKSSTFTHQII
jgi:hypothetical protein